MKRFVLLAVPLLLTGCSFGFAQPQATVTVTVTAQPGPAADATPPSASQPASTQAKIYGLGEWQETQGLRARVVELRQDVSTFNQKPDRAVLYEICGAGRGGEIQSWSLFLAGDDDGGQYPGSSSRYEDYPKPGFPFSGAKIPDDACVKGWVVFDTNEDTRITKTAFQMDDGRAMAWRIA